jgi:hypothetical protein
MDHHDGNAIGVPALLHIDAVPAAHLQHPLVKRVKRGVKHL